jgi:hypothetical protein
MRADLLALTADGLAALTNRGLVKRAAKELDAAPAKVLSEPDGAVRVDFADGVTARLPAGAGLDGGSCTCGAPGTCRHLVALVLAYQREHEAPAPAGEAEAPAPAFVAWSPGELTDEALERALGARLLGAARRVLRAGYTARVRRPSPDDPVARVELSSCTVRFLVPHELGFVHTDAAQGVRDDVVALAVWAFRAADVEAPDAVEAYVEVGGSAGGGDSDPGLDRALALADDILREGATHLGAAIAARFADVRRQLDTAGLRWPLLALDELAEQLEAYRDRGSRYRPEAVAGLLTELHARHRAVANRGASPRSRVLGTEEAAETPLRRARLDSLGCRIAATGDERVAEVFLAHADTATVLVLRRRWTTDDTSQLTGHELARRRVAGATLGALAAGNLVTESAARSASRTIALTSSRVAKTSVTPSIGAWDQLPDQLLVRDLDAAGRELDALPPRLIRPRIEAEFVRAVEIAEVRSIGYTPGDQRLEAVIADRSGATGLIVATHRAACPAALDALAAALESEPRFVSGALHRTRGTVVIDPLGIVAGGRVVVPDIAEGAGDAALVLASDGLGDPVEEAIDGALSLLAEVAHRGLEHLPGTFAGRLRDAAQGLSGVGLRRAAGSLDAVAATLGPDPGDAAVRAWVDAQIRLSVTADRQ